MSITISCDPTRHNIDAIHRIVAGTYWSPNIRREVVAEALLVKVVQDAVEESRRRVRALGHAVSRAAAVLRILRHPRRGCRRICERHPRRGCWPVVHRRACGRGAGK